MSILVCTIYTKAPELTEAFLSGLIVSVVFYSTPFTAFKIKSLYFSASLSEP